MWISVLPAARICVNWHLVVHAAQIWTVKQYVKSVTAQDWVLGHITKRCAAQNWSIQPYFEPWQYETELQAARLRPEQHKTERLITVHVSDQQHKGGPWAVLKMVSRQHWNKCPDNQNCSIIHYSAFSSNSTILSERIDFIAPCRQKTNGWQRQITKYNIVIYLLQNDKS